MMLAMGTRPYKMSYVTYGVSDFMGKGRKQYLLTKSQG